MPIDLYRSTATRLFLGAAAGEPDGIPVLDPDSPDCRDLLFPAAVGYGHDPGQYVPDMMAAPDRMRAIPPAEYDARFDEQERTQSSLEHLYLRDWRGECLDQNGQGYCWSYSTGAAVMMTRLKANMPFVRLNPHSVASLVKGGRDEGGWCGLSLAFARDNGYAAEGSGPTQWPPHGFGAAANRRFADPALKAAMQAHRVTDDWYDLGKPHWGQQLKDAQLRTVLLNNCPAPSDFNWWGHSVCALRHVRIEAGGWGLLVLNSWRGWGRRGLAVLRGSQARPDGAVSVVATMAA